MRPPAIPPMAAPMATPLNAAMIGPAAMNGPTPGIASAPMPAIQPKAPPITPPVTAYDLLITDSVMPKVSGVELLKKINAAGMPLPVIMATATFPEQAFVHYPELQPKMMLLKPHDMTDLLEAVEEVLHAHNGVCEKPVPPVCQVQPTANRRRL
jgi:CheY-like chemotaxis protein